MEIKLPENCNQCHNACPAEELKCGRGQAYFEALKRGETPPERGPRERSSSEHPLVRALTACGRTAEHISERLRANGKDEGELFGSLTQEEQEELQRILGKLDQAWQAERAKHHGAGHHEGAGHREGGHHGGSGHHGR